MASTSAGISWERGFARFSIANQASRKKGRSRGQGSFIPDGSRGTRCILSHLNRLATPETVSGANTQDVFSSPHPERPVPRQPDARCIYRDPRRKARGPTAVRGPLPQPSERLPKRLPVRLRPTSTAEVANEPWTFRRNPNAR